MYTLKNVRNPDQGLVRALSLLVNTDFTEDTRNGPVLSLDGPICVEFADPINRVSLLESRDANPFFHLMESMWILEGRDDVKFLAEFNKQMVNYSDDGVVFNAAYGRRLRGRGDIAEDQLEKVINVLRKDQNSRQAVALIWDQRDLTKNTLDKACNMALNFRVVAGKLDLTVMNRSNDCIWGMFGANAVQFSMILEYVAAKLNLPVGRYFQFSNNLHTYLEGKAGEQLNNIRANSDDDYYEWERMVASGDCDFVKFKSDEMSDFDSDLEMLFNVYDEQVGLNLNLLTVVSEQMKSSYFADLIVPMLSVWYSHRVDKQTEKAIEICDYILDDHWKLACINWLTRRL